MKEKTEMTSDFSSKETKAKYLQMKCDYGWEKDNSFNGKEIIGKFASDGVTPLKCGMYVRNPIVSGQIVYYKTSDCFRVEVLECRYKKDMHSCSLFYPTPIGRESKTNWEVFQSGDLTEWLNDFPQKITKTKQEEED